MTTDAVIVGAGPNGLLAAITLARAGWSVQVLEATGSPGGGCRSMRFGPTAAIIDHGAAVMPMAVLSPAMQSIPLASHGLRWCQPPIPLAHLLDEETALALYPSIPDTAAQFGSDADAYQRLMTPLVRDAERIMADLAGPLRWPRHPLTAARFGWWGLRSMRHLTSRTFQEERAPALLAGLAAHATLPLTSTATAAFGLILGLAGHRVGWPVVAGGSGQLTAALVAELDDLGGELRLNTQVRTLQDIPPSRVVLFDLHPRQVEDIAGDVLPRWYRWQLSRFRQGPAVFKMDWLLDGPVPWRAPLAHEAGTLHLGGTFEQIAAAEAAVARGQHPEEPFLILAQPSRFDPRRVSAGQETLWGYAHVPVGSTRDLTETIEARIERVAPGFRRRIIARRITTADTFAEYNPSLIAGDIGGGANDLRQLFFRPVPRFSPYRTPNRQLYLCSASTPPGGGVHGLSGWYAARQVLRDHEGPHT